MINKKAFTLLFSILSLNLFSEESTLDNTLESCINFAMKNNPSIIKEAKMIDVKKMKRDIAKSIPNPQIALMFMNSNDDSKFGAGKASISQMLPFPGKIKAKKDAATGSIATHKMIKKNIEITIAGNVRDVYISLYIIGKKIEYTKISLILLKQMESILLSNYATATGSQMALLKLQTKMAITENMITTLSEMGDRTKYKLEYLLNSSKVRDFDYPESIPSLSIEGDILTQQSLEDNQSLLIQKSKIEESKLNLNSIKKSNLPDFMILGSYTGSDYVMSMSMPKNGEDLKGELGLGLSVVLPVWFKTNRAKVGAIENQIAVENEKLKEEELKLLKNISIALLDLKDAERQISLHDNVLIPKAKQTLELVYEMYANGQVSILDFLDADKTLLDLQIMKLDFIKKRELKATEIMYNYLSKVVN